MSKTFRKWSPNQQWLLPPSPRDWLAENHLVYFLMDVVGTMDLAPFYQRYKNSVGGQPPFHPQMMVTLLLYAYCRGVFSSRKIKARCREDVAFRVIVGDDVPDFRTISDFRKDNLEHMQTLFVQTLQVCAEAGLVKLGRVALDGSKFKANASRHKAMSYDRMQHEEERLQAEIAELLKQADSADEDDDSRFGDCGGEELPDELARRESRLQKIQEAKAALEQAARQWCGRLGKIENCQVGVYLGYVSGKVHALVDTELYLPKQWTQEKARLKRAGVPKDKQRQRTRHELALELLDARENRCRMRGSLGMMKWADRLISA